MEYLYIASCEKDGGIYRFANDNGKLSPIDKTPCPEPMYMAKQNDTLYVLLRAPFADGDDSGVISFHIEKDGSLSSPTAPVSSAGDVGCHLAVDGEDVYVANYVSGSVCYLGKETDTHCGKGVHPQRQTAPHCHSVVLSPDKKYLLSCDLGLDTVFIYSRDLKKVGEGKSPAGAGCRHMVFSNDGNYLYVANELGSSVSVFAYDKDLPSLTLLSTVSALQKPVQSIAAAIRLSADGRKLYVTNRGENTVAVFDVSRKNLTLHAAYPTEDNEPRDFILFDRERYTLVANQFGNSVVVYRHNNGELIKTDKIALPSPLAALEF
ncbi:MAG: lactonase family protein [Clostridia bacterium]|nr:lactonase family protein [Clostridia bacterium]